MKNIILPTFAAIFFISFLPSCQKDTVSQNNVTPIDTIPNTTTSGPLLKEYYSIDTTVMSTLDTVVRGYFYYDGQDRPVSVVSYLTSPLNGDTTGTTSYRFFYSGTDSLAYMSIDSYADYVNGTLTQSSSDTFYYSFSNGECNSDSNYAYDAQNIPSYAVHQYQYLAADKMKIDYTIHYGSNLPTAYIYSTTLYQSFDGSDILHQIDTTIRTFPASNQWSKEEHTASYLPNPNPFAKFSNAVRRPKLAGDISIYSQREAPRKLYAQHNCIHDGFTGSTVTSHDEWNVQYAYIFRADGYPSEIREVYSDNGTLSYSKAVLVYQ
jgi:hypothetical protein